MNRITRKLAPIAAAAVTAGLLCTGAVAAQASLPSVLDASAPCGWCTLDHDHSLHGWCTLNHDHAVDGTCTLDHDHSIHAGCTLVHDHCADACGSGYSNTTYSGTTYSVTNYSGYGHHSSGHHGGGHGCHH